MSYEGPHPIPPASGGTGVNNGSNTLTVSANSSINQNVTTAGQPKFFSVATGSNGIGFLNFKCGEALTADRDFIYIVGDSNRTVTLNGNPTLSDWFDQSVKVASSPTFSAVKLPGTSASNLLTIQANPSNQVAAATVNITANTNSGLLLGGGTISFTGGNNITFQSAISNQNVQMPTISSFIVAALSQPADFSNITVNNGGRISSGTSNGNTYSISVYDVDDSTPRAFATATAGNTPTFAWLQPSGGTLTWDGGAIGSTTPTTGKFTTLTETTATVYSTTSTAVSVTQSTTYIGVTDNSSARTITLSTADASVAGTIRIIKDEAGTAASANNITIAGQGGETIDNAASLLITANFGCARLIARNSKWWTF